MSTSEQSRNERIQGPREPIYPGAVLEYDIPGGPDSEERARAYIEDPFQFDPPEPKVAATVMLLSRSKPHRRYLMLDGEEDRSRKVVVPSEGPIDVFMMKRVPTMSFVPNAVVFPGGGMDERDVDVDIPWAGPSVEEWAASFGTSPARAKGVIAAAVRELFEESGILLAGPDMDTMAQDERGDHWGEERRRVASREISLGELLAERNWLLRSDLLGLQSHWVTPLSETRRYDTYFFTARLPHGQHADGRTSEAAEAGWISPQEVLRQFDEGRILLVPPTISNLTILAAAESVDAALERPFSGNVEPYPVIADDGRARFRSVVR